MTKKTILVTGGTGFLGSYLLRYLLENGDHQIRAIKRPTSSMALVESVKDKIEWIDCDVLDVLGLEDAMRGVDQIYHCAAIVSFEPRFRKTMMQINVEGTANIVNLALEEGIGKLVFVSSVAAIGRRKNIKEIDENNKWERSDFNAQYAISKHMAEQEVWRGIAEGLTASIINPAVILGSGFWEKGTAKFFKNAWKGFGVYPIGGSGFVDVRDVCRLMIAIMHDEKSSERYIACGENCTYQKLFNDIAQSLNKKIPSIKLTPFLGAIAWRVDWLRSRIFNQQSLITKETVQNSARTWVYKNQKSINTFNFKYTPFQQTIRETSHQFLEATKNEFQPMYLPLI